MSEVSEGWRRSTRCGESTHCVEINFGDGMVGMRDNKAIKLGALVFTSAVWEGFMQDVQAGKFDSPVQQ